MNTYLITIIGDSGREFCLSFDCEDEIDVEAMLRDCGIRGRVDGIKVSEQMWEDMPEAHQVQ